LASRRSMKDSEISCFPCAGSTILCNVQDHVIIIIAPVEIADLLMVVKVSSGDDDGPIFTMFQIDTC
jgi:hypothetical protein